jgi:hypothetical protein
MKWYEMELDQWQDSTSDRSFFCDLHHASGRAGLTDNPGWRWTRELANLTPRIGNQSLFENQSFVSESYATS